MVGEYEQYLYFPLFVAIAGGLLVYLVQLWLQRGTIHDALLTEINSILNHAKETLDYLSESNHYWLVANEVLSRAPSDTKLTTSTYSALLPQAHLLGRQKVVRILHFYAQYERCENLKVSLFSHIRDHVEGKKPLTDLDVKLLNIRRHRLCEGYRSLLGSPIRQIEEISSLPTEYTIPSTKEIAVQINAALSPEYSQVSSSNPKGE